MKHIWRTGIGAQLAAVLVLVFIFWSLTTPNRLSFLLYPLAREAVEFRIDYATRQLSSVETEHFVIKYHALDQEKVKMVAASAEAAYKPVGQILNYQPQKKSLVIIYPDRAAMKEAYGWASESSAMGFYWGGVIQILSPRAWLEDKNSASEFKQKGPMAHEYMHLAIDYLLQGNYPRWFTEGAAQYAEYKINGFEWITNNNSLTQKWYSLNELDKNFDSLPNQALAYRQSFSIVRYIIENHGENSFGAILKEMKKGAGAAHAIKNATGLNYGELELKVKTWAEKNMALVSTF